MVLSCRVHRVGSLLPIPERGPTLGFSATSPDGDGRYVQWTSTLLEFRPLSQPRTSPCPSPGADASGGDGAEAGKAPAVPYRPRRWPHRRHNVLGLRMGQGNW